MRRGQRRIPGLLKACWWVMMPLTEMRNPEETDFGGWERRGDEFKFEHVNSEWLGDAQMMLSWKWLAIRLCSPGKET